MPLFRSESEAARANAWLGRILLARPVSFTFLSLAALSVAVALAAFFCLGEYTHKARVQGVLAPMQGVVKVVAQQAGVVQALGAREGARVGENGALLTLVDARAGASSDSLAQRRRALEWQRTHTLASLDHEQAAIVERHRGLARELEQLDIEMGVHGRRLAVARQGLDRWQHLERTGFVSAATADREREATLEHELRLEATRRTRLALTRELASVQADARTSRTRGLAQLAAIDAQRASLDQERAERGVQQRLGVRAPVSGTVATVLVELGQMVPAGTTLATIIPSDARLEAHLYAPSRSIGFVRPGHEVLLRYTAYPHQKFGSHPARVTSIARTSLSPADLGFNPPDGSREPLYRIKVELAAQTIAAYGREEPLQPGMQVEADILLDRRRLIEWVFEPLLSLAGRA